jgi:hypothetical protein
VLAIAGKLLEYFRARKGKASDAVIKPSLASPPAGNEGGSQALQQLLGEVPGFKQV